jgi:predicted AAA+ superfamily ATPase
MWRSKHGHEVDVLIGDTIAIEIKSSNKVAEKHLKGLISLKEEGIFKKYILVSHNPFERKVNDITIMHWKVFLTKLWSDNIYIS